METQTQISRSQLMEHPNERPGTVTKKTTQIRMKWTFLSQMKLHNNPFRSQWSVQLLYMNDVVALMQTVVTMPIKRSRIILYMDR